MRISKRVVIHFHTPTFFKHKSLTTRSCSWNWQNFLHYHRILSPFYTLNIFYWNRRQIFTPTHARPTHKHEALQTDLAALLSHIYTQKTYIYLIKQKMPIYWLHFWRTFLHVTEAHHTITDDIYHFRTNIYFSCVCVSDLSRFSSIIWIPKHPIFEHARSNKNKYLRQGIF